MIYQLSDTGRYWLALFVAVFAIGIVLLCLRQHRKGRPVTRGVYSIYGRRVRNLNVLEKLLAQLRII